MPRVRQIFSVAMQTASVKAGNGIRNAESSHPGDARCR